MCLRFSVTVLKAKDEVSVYLVIIMIIMNVKQLLNTMMLAPVAYLTKREFTQQHFRRCDCSVE